MKNILFAFTLIGLLLFSAGCGEEDLYEKYGPEIIFYQYESEGVRTTEFNSIKLDADQVEYSVFARVSAPFKLGEIKVYRDGSLVNTISDFSEEKKPTEYFLKQLISNITATTKITIVATDLDKKLTEKTFEIIK